MIPEKFWQVIMAFLKGKKTGQLVIHVHDGNVLKLDVVDSIRV